LIQAPQNPTRTSRLTSRTIVLKISTANQELNSERLDKNGTYEVKRNQEPDHTRTNGIRQCRARLSGGPTRFVRPVINNAINNARPSNK